MLLPQTILQRRAPTSPSLMFRYTFFCLFVPWANRKLTFVQTSAKQTHITYWHISPSPVAVILFYFTHIFRFFLSPFVFASISDFYSFHLRFDAKSLQQLLLLSLLLLLLVAILRGKRQPCPQSLYQDPCAPIALKVVCCVLKWLPPASSRATNRRWIKIQKTKLEVVAERGQHH